MGKRGKVPSSHLANIGIVRPPDQTMTIKEIQDTVANIKIIDDSIAKHPIPPATVTE